MTARTTSRVAIATPRANLGRLVACRVAKAPSALENDCTANTLRAVCGQAAGQRRHSSLPNSRAGQQVDIIEPKLAAS